jgi:hypothetical protein
MLYSAHNDSIRSNERKLHTSHEASFRRAASFHYSNVRFQAALRDFFFSDEVFNIPWKNLVFTVLMALANYSLGRRLQLVQNVGNLHMSIPNIVDFCRILEVRRASNPESSSADELEIKDDATRRKAIDFRFEKVFATPEKLRI